MTRTCTVCAHPERAAIERVLIGEKVTTKGLQPRARKATQGVQKANPGGRTAIYPETPKAGNQQGNKPIHVHMHEQELTR